MLHGMTRIQLNSVLSIASVATTTSSALTRRWGERFRRGAFACTFARCSGSRSCNLSVVSACREEVRP